MTLTIFGRVPSKKNSKRIVQTSSRPRLISSDAYLAWHEEQMLRIKRHKPKQPIPAAHVAITFFAGTRRKFDLSNAAESVMDLLVDAGILADDSYDVVPRLLLTYGGLDPSNPRVEVELATFKN